MNFINQLLESLKKKVYSSLRDSILGVDLADMKSLTKYNNGIKYLLCAIDLCGGCVCGDLCVDYSYKR